MGFSGQEIVSSIKLDCVILCNSRVSLRSESKSLDEMMNLIRFCHCFDGDLNSCLLNYNYFCLFLQCLLV